MDVKMTMTETTHLKISLIIRYTITKIMSSAVEETVGF
jgi:hypothetical protein